MSYYLDPKKVKQSGAPSKFGTFRIGEEPEYPGIYECQVCAHEIVMNRDADPFPPCSNCKKTAADNKQWLLLVRAQNASEKK